MSAIDLVMDEVQSRFGRSGTKASSLLSGLLSFMTHRVAASADSSSGSGARVLETC